MDAEQQSDRCPHYLPQRLLKPLSRREKQTTFAVIGALYLMMDTSALMDSPGVSLGPVAGAPVDKSVVGIGVV